MRNPTYATEDDKRREAEIAARCASAWDCKMVAFPFFFPCDYWAERRGKMTAIIEMKCHNRPVDERPNVGLNLSKWFRMRLLTEGFGAAGLNIPALYVVRFLDDTILYGDLARVDPNGPPEITGFGNPENHRDIQPCVWLKISDLVAVP